MGFPIGRGVIVALLVGAAIGVGVSMFIDNPWFANITAGVVAALMARMVPA